MSKSAIITYIDDFKRMRECGATADQIGRLQFALIEYAETREVPQLDPDIVLAFGLLANKFDRDDETYQKKVAAGSKGGQRSAEVRSDASADESKSKQIEADSSTSKQNEASGSTQKEKEKEKNQKKNKEKKELELERERERARVRERGIGFQPAARTAPGPVWKSDTGSRDAPGYQKKAVAFGYLQRNDSMADVLMDL